MSQRVAQDGKETLLSWIARQLVSATPPLAVLRTELPHVASPQLRVAVDEAGSALASVEQGLADVRCELQYSSSEMCGVAGGSGAALQAMVSDLETQLEAAKRLLQECRDGFAVMAAFFGESASAMAALEQELWLPLQAFVGSFSDAQVAVLQQQKEEADRQRRQLDRTSSSSGRGRPTGPSLREQQAADKGKAEGQQPANGTAAWHSKPAVTVQAEVLSGTNAAAAPAGAAATERQRPGSAARQLDFPSPQPSSSEASGSRPQELLQQAGSASDP